MDVTATNFLSYFSPCTIICYIPAKKATLSWSLMRSDFLQTTVFTSLTELAKDLLTIEPRATVTWDTPIVHNHATCPQFSQQLQHISACSRHAGTAIDIRERERESTLKRSIGCTSAA